MSIHWGNPLGNLGIDGNPWGESEIIIEFLGLGCSFWQVGMVEWQGIIAMDQTCKLNFDDPVKEGHVATTSK